MFPAAIQPTDHISHIRMYVAEEDLADIPPIRDVADRRHSIPG